ncbi:arginase [Vibrio rotiferianus]|uniref:arginase family protein n=1 Tax=Vibrio rotiferianus TaxID=190895 RepID=UPI001110B384|nr:arginase family protein [Vibrio rotiferianus]TMX32025.1 arginase [Vibrio rotiferianus]TMX55269.1 arginase [Vibrio rotiferianus]TMX66204.1 arginase [Vibrio rotiferianus]
MKRSFDIIGAPFNQLGFVPTRENTVDGLRCMNELTWVGLSDWIDVRNSRWGADIQDLGDVVASDIVHSLIASGNKETALAEYSNSLKLKLVDSYQNNRIPITIGGDHSVAVGTIPAALEYYQKERKEKVAVVWVDAHADCNQSIESNLHGKPLALLMNKYHHNGWSIPKELQLEPEQVFYIGVRDLMPNEYDLLEGTDITNYDMSCLDRIGIQGVLDDLIAQIENRFDRVYLSFDYDALDGSIFRACATPNVGGLSAREAIHVVHTICSNSKFIGADFVEYMPELDTDGVSKELMIKLIDTVWGFRA